MDDGAPTLEVGFLINPGTSFDELQRLSQLMQSAEFKALQSAGEIQKAFNGLNLSGGTAQITAFGAAASREMQEAARATSLVEKSGEGLVRQLQRQTETFGKTSSEIRQMRVELKATEAESRGMTELAARLRAVSAEMDRLEGSSGRAAIAGNKNAFALRQTALQLPDIIGGLLSGQRPFQVAIQQGGQLTQVAQMAEGGMAGFARSLIAATLPFAPFIAAAAVAGAGFGLFVRDVEKGVDTKAMVAGLGLTHDEIKKLKDVSIDTGDVVKATFEVMARNLGFSLGNIKSFFADAMDFLTTWGRRTLAGLYAMFLGTFKAIGAVVQAGFNGKGVVEMGTAALDAYRSMYTEASDKLKKFGADVTKQAGSDKLAALRKQRDEIVADRSPKSDAHAASLAREAAAIEAQIRNLYKLADAYAVSGAAALIAEARVKAESDAIKKRADIEELVDRQLRLAIAQRVSDAAKATRALTDQADIQAQVNGEVAAGNIPAERAQEIVRQRIAELPLLAALEVAQQRGLKKEVDAATAALDRQREAQATVRGTDLASQSNLENAAAERQLAMLREELRLVGATEAARARALALVKATQDAQLKYSGDNGFSKRAIDDAMAVYDATAAVAAKTEDWKESLSDVADQWGIIADNVQDGARGMADAFGEVGKAVGDMASIYADFRAGEARAQAIHLENLRTAKSQGAVDRENAKFALASSGKQIQMFGDLAATAKGFFKEGSAGYQALGAAEKVFRAFQFANSVRAMVQDVSETIASVTNSAARATAAGAEGVAKQAKLPFPFNIAAMAATAAALVAAGIAILGSGGGSSGPSFATAEDYQKSQGTGSVLGDSAAKSASIANAIELVAKNTNKDLEYSSQMVRSLKAIDGNIGNLTSLVARELSVGGGLDASKLGLGTNSGGGFLGIGGLFSKTVTTELNDSGLTFGSTTVGSAIADGITANLYQEILKTTKKSGFLGIGGSTKTSIETVTAGADSALTSEVSRLIDNMRKSIVAAAGTIGIDGASAMLDAFQINIGRISFKGLSSSEIESQLSAVFSRVGDDMAGAVAGGLGQFQRAGEGMLETLVRLAKEYQTVDVSLRSIGMTFGAVGLASIGARTALVELFGGLDAFTEQTDFFRENFLSEAEQMAPIIAAVKAEMDRLGESGITTKDQFKSLVLSLDLSTDAGREMYAALMAVAPAFAKTADYAASLNGELKSVAKTAEELAAIAKQRRDLEIQLMDATGDAAGALAAKRSDELAAMDDSLRALQQQVWAAQDAAAAARDLAAANAEAARAATALAASRRSLEIELMEAQGDATGALSAKRADELAAMDASLRALKEQVWAAQDAAAANTALAQAQAAAAQTALALASQRSSLEIALMRAQGDEAGAVSAERTLQLAALDESLRGLQQQVWAAEDARAAAEAARAAAEAAAQAQAAQAQAAQQAAEEAEQLRRTHAGLEADLLDAMGNATGALAIRRREELAAIDASLRPLKQAIWLQQDMAAKISAARDTLTASYKRETEALQGTIDRFTGFGDSLRKFRDTLGATKDATGDAYLAALARFNVTDALAAQGNETALGSLEKAGQDFLSISRDRAGSLLDYQRDVARVAASVDRAIGASDNAVDYAKLQLDALKQSVTGLIDINTSVVSVHDAILVLQAALADRDAPAPVAELPPTAFTPSRQQQPFNVDTGVLERRLDALGERLDVQSTAIAENTGKMVRAFDRWDGGGLLVRTDEDEPLAVTGS